METTVARDPQKGPSPSLKPSQGNTPESRSPRPNPRKKSVREWLTDQPFNQFRRNRNFYPQYDSGYLIAGLSVLAAFQLSGWQPLFPEWKSSYWAWVPVVCLLQTFGGVFIHNAAHGNFPKAINRLVGEICGILVLTRFASWQIVHVRHHTYSDNIEKDPHPLHQNFWVFCWNTIKNVEIQLQNQFFDLHGGDTPANRAFEKRRAILSYLTNIVMFMIAYELLGTAGFLGFFVPGFIVEFLHIEHFNWATHNALAKNGDFHPVNLDRGIFWFGNRLFFGIYMHGNHHKNPNIFNPLKMRERKVVGTA